MKSPSFRGSSADGQRVARRSEKPSEGARAVPPGQIEDWLIARISDLAGVSPSEIDAEAPLSSLGLDSRDAVRLSGELEELLGRRFPPTLAYEYPTIRAIARHLAGHSSTSMSRGLDRQQPAATEPVAIVGIGCRFPGADGPDAFWDLLRNGVDAVAEVPAGRWRHRDDLANTSGGFLPGIDGFDADFFAIAPREAELMDPQQRLLLEVAWEAIEHAGLSPASLAGSFTGVFVGISTGDYAHLLARTDLASERHVATGTAFSIAANRLSYVLDLRGPSLAIDTACSSSIVAVHLAVASLRRGECDLALAGGVNLLITPDLTAAFTRANMLAPRGRCRTFDAEAEGYVRGEGCGLVVLRRLSDAAKNGDHVLAVIRGSAVNQDGRTNGLTAPSGHAQQAVMRSALADAGLLANEISYVEAHGTGTPLGDPIEVEAIKGVFLEGRSWEALCAIGSVKTNIGHLEAAAGVAGLIKVALMLRHRQIPPHLHLRQLNPHISLDGTPLRIPVTGGPWPAAPGSALRRAGVSSFGFGGTNCHVVVEEAPDGDRPVGHDGRPAQLFTLSARTDRALAALAERYVDHLAANQSVPLADLCYTVTSGRSHFAHRLAAVTRSVEELQAQLRSFVSTQRGDRVVTGLVNRRALPKIAFLFTGQGAQYVGMGQQLYRTQPTFRRVLDTCDEILRPHLERSLLSVLYPDPGEDTSAPLDETSYTQPALFAVEYALAMLWRSWGIVPGAALGHSVGEYVAACLAGVFDLEEGLRLLADRARLMQAQPGQGAMATIWADEGAVARVLRSKEREVAIAAVNGPRMTVISGRGEAVETVMREFQVAGVNVQRLPVSHAFHSPLMDPVLDAFGRRASQVTFKAGELELISTVTGRPAAGDMSVPEYWVRQLRAPVQFALGMRTLHQLGYDHFIEIGPRPSLLAMGRTCVPDGTGSWLPSIRPEREWEELLSSVATLYARGADVDWAGFHADYRLRRVALPTYPFERRRYWIGETQPAETAGLFAEADAQKDAGRHRRILELVESFGDDAALAINRRVSAPLTFMTRGGRSLCYVNRRGASLAVVSYAGPDSEYAEAMRELLTYARDQGLIPTVLATEDRAGLLRELGFSTTPVGTWQSLEDISRFSLEGGSARRVRSKVNSYRNRGPCSTDEYVVGSDPGVNEQIVQMIDEWVARKPRKAAFVELLKQEILSGTLDRRQRLFLTRSGGRLDSVVLLSPIASRHGYLMDLEFYRADVPSGCLEFAIVQIIERLREEGVTYFSLGSTFGTQLGTHENDDPQVRELLQILHDRNVLNDDGNFEFKRKFNPRTVRLYLCRPRGADAVSLHDAIAAFSDPTGEASAAAEGATDSGARSAPEQQGSRIDRARPLAGRRLSLALRETVVEYQLDTRVEALSFLEDHRLFGKVIVPAAVLLEMVRSAAASAFDGRPVIVTELRFQQPLVLAHERACSVQLVMGRTSEAGMRFEVHASTHRPGEEPRWAAYASGAIAPAEVDGDALSPAWPRGGVEERRAACREEIATAAYISRIRALGVELGPRFQSLDSLWRGDGEAMARIRIPDALATAGGSFGAHPVLLDGCFHAMAAAALLGRGAGALAVQAFVPHEIGQFRVHRPLEVEVWAHACLVPQSGDGANEFTGDVTVFTASGQLAAELQGVVFRRASAVSFQLAAGETVSDLTYRLDWLRRDSTDDGLREDPATAGAWLILSNGSGVGDRLAELLRLRGERCLRALPAASYGAVDPETWEIDPSDPSHFRRLLQDAFASRDLTCRGVVHLWGIGSENAEHPTLVSVHEAQTLGCAAALHMVQALVQSDIGGAPRLWFVTRTTQTVGPDPAPVDPGPASLWGLGRSLAWEHPELWGGLVDFGRDDPSVEAEALLQEIREPNDDDQVAFRGGQRYVARLVAAPLSATSAIQVRGDASYLVTGGLGALGLTVARWLVARGARHLMLLGRTGDSAVAARETLADLRSAGAQVLVLQVDVGDGEQLAAALERARGAMPLISGVIHAAGVLADGALVHQTWSRFQQVARPKVDGAWQLHRLARQLDLPLDFFIVFSSVASVLGSPGQANYAAANAFMDGLARYRRSLDLPALSLQWGPWEGLGMAARRGDHRAPGGAELRALRLWESLEAFERALHAQGELAVLSLDRTAVASSGGWTRVASVLRDQRDDAPGMQADEGLVRALLDASPDERRGLVETHLCTRMARILKRHPGEIDREASLLRLGFDSLMALELRKEVSDDFGVPLPVANLFGGDGVVDFAGYLLERLAQRHPQVRPSSPTSAAAKIDLHAEARLGFEITAENRLSRIDTRDPATVFLTGATGFVGAFLLRELLETTKARIYCLVRAASEPAGLAKIRENLRSYGVRDESWDESLVERIVPVPGDVTRPALGLSPEAFDRLADEMEVVYHIGGNTNLAYKYKLLRPTNVIGTKEVIKLAASRYLKPFHYLSSYGIFDSIHNIDQVFTEQDEPTQPEGLANGYCESKWVGEKTVRNARAAGLPVCIYRVGWVAGHSQTGAWHKTDFMPRLIQIATSIRKICDLGGRTMTPVDHLTKALVHLSKRKDSLGGTFHLSNGERYSSDQLFAWVRSFGYELEDVPFETWEKEVKLSAEDPASNLILLVLDDISQRHLGFSEWFSREPRIDVSHTRAILADSSITRPTIDEKLLHMYLSYFIANGYLSPPAHSPELAQV